VSALVLNRRDIEFFKYLHSCKVATTKQINRDIFKKAYQTCYLRVYKFHQKKFIEQVANLGEVDQSFVYSLTSRGMKVVNANLKDIINGKRFKSDSVSHDLKLVNIRNIFSNLKIVKDYITENQLQTYDLSFWEDDLSSIKEMRVDAVAWIQDTGKPKLMIPVELEISTKAGSEYLNKITEIYYQRDIKFFFCICDTKETERKIKKVELDFIQDGKKKIFYTTYKNIISNSGEISFTNLDSELITLK
jgi:hypothetical protein